MPQHYAIPNRAALESSSAVGNAPDVEASTSETSPPSIEQLRADLDRLRQREAQIMALIGCKNPDKLMHDLRNLLNEVQLLRVLADVDKA